ncbi:hypothetical protein Pla108_15900 [Botrimarina colliarenosi]|uniref:Uncharacterized protein n=1 Tax=Botrimarina colliarenosi TaxID=2528001 RepID=A0A5C6AMB4_9BACT|nr:hypothetical protein [Botrimarina colliarenosi]TWU00638.1 hypothetical protein Pla108_15900 [Botrimarina colliarenosi]
MSELWGYCKECKWWQIEPGASRTDTTGGVCIDNVLQRYLFRVNGNSGCNRFVEGPSPRRDGSSETPPDEAIVMAQ